MSRGSMPRGVRLRPGVYRVPGEPYWPATLAGRRWSTARVEPVEDLRQAYDAIGQALQLPAWFGHNLDALWDCLTDLQTPTAVLWRRWDGLEAAQPTDAARLLDLLRDRTTQPPDFAVVLGGPGGTGGGGGTDAARRAASSG